MRRLSTISIVAATLAFGLGMTSPDDSQAGVRARVDIQKDVGPAKVRVRLQTPDFVRHHRNPDRGYGHVDHVRVNRHDRRIIHRLSIVSGVPERPLLRKRARGLSWRRIARMHGISRYELRVARNPARFRAWLRAFDDHGGRRGGGRGGHGSGRGGHGGGYGGGHGGGHGGGYGGGHGCEFCDG